MIRFVDVSEAPAKPETKAAVKPKADAVIEAAPEKAPAKRKAAKAPRAKVAAAN